MKALLLIFTLVFSSSFVLFHDVPVAIFNISKSNDSVQISIVFDLDDFQESMAIKTHEIDLGYMQCYLEEKTSFQFNGQRVILKVLELKKVRGHVRVIGSFGKLVQKIKTIKIENNCLSNIPNHSNIIEIDINDISKDYRMHKGRTEINLTY